MYLTNFHFYNYKNYLYSKPVKGLQGYGIGYGFSFQGQESDNEIKGEGNIIVYTYRIHDTRLGRFLSVDPLIKEYPELSSYAFSGNQVIHTTELEGAEPLDYLGIGDHVGAFQSSSEYEYKWNPSKAALRDGMFLIVSSTGFNLVDNYVTEMLSSTNSSDRTEITLNMASALSSPVGIKGIKTPKPVIKLTKQEQILVNAEKGAKFEKEVAKKKAKNQVNQVTQLSLKTKSGTNVRVDLAGQNKKTKAIELTEAKSSEKAPLTKAQKNGYPEIAESGATVTSRNKNSPFTWGTEIPPTNVEVIRPPLAPKKK